jgi:hypothetical protein
MYNWEPWFYEMHKGHLICRKCAEIRITIKRVKKKGEVVEEPIVPEEVLIPESVPGPTTSDLLKQHHDEKNSV